MPRFHFNLRNGSLLPDPEGREFPTVLAARDHAIAEARALASDDVRSGHLDLKHSIEISDEDGTALLVVTFKEAVTISY
jgi:hypothetical protein